MSHLVVHSLYLFASLCDNANAVSDVVFRCWSLLTVKIAGE